MTWVSMTAAPLEMGVLKTGESATGSSEYVLPLRGGVTIAEIQCPLLSSM